MDDRRTWTTIRTPVELDFAAAADFEATLQAAIAANDAVSVDCAGLRFVDSTGARVILMAYAAARDENAVIRLVNISGGPLQVLRMLGVLDLFEKNRARRKSGRHLVVQPGFVM